MAIKIKVWHIIFTLFLLSKVSISSAQNTRIKVYEEQFSNGIIRFYADNYHHCPISLNVMLQTRNIKIPRSAQKTFIVPGVSGRIFLFELKANAQSYGYQYNWMFTLGDVTKRRYNKKHPYDLPFLSGASFYVSQGYHGSFSHQNVKAIDFVMPEGTPITAMNNGIVVEVVDNHNQGCPSVDCSKFNNYISIYHYDGTFANYSHLLFNGAKVMPGDRVRQGQVIGLSGNTGFSTNPHLHIEVFMPSFGRSRSIKTKFKVGNGKRKKILKPSRVYSKNY
jgi:murein DD-endopeptidase MepM/ murein hydrolase activator NlpD